MRLRISLWSGTLLLASTLAGAQEPPLFQVKGYGVHVGNEVVYHYRVINNSPTNVAKPVKTSQIEIGRASLDGDPELIGLVPTSYPPVYDDGVLDMTAPIGWKGVVSGEEEHVRHTLLWETIEHPSSSYALLPGQTLTGLSVRRTNVNPTYLNSHFFIIAGDGAGKFSGLIEREDATAPTLSVSVNPSVLWPPNDKPITVTATLAVNDDYDLQPEIRLESITANETLAASDIVNAAVGTDDRAFGLNAKRDGSNKTGRIYTITYSATDASGNKITASTTVTVPHDQGK